MVVACQGGMADGSQDPFSSEVFCDCRSNYVFFAIRQYVALIQTTESRLWMLRQVYNQSQEYLFQT